MKEFKEFEVAGYVHSWSAAMYPLRPLIVQKRRWDSDTWVVSLGVYVIDRDLGVTFEPMPSNRDDDFIARTRFDLNTAIDIANRFWYKNKGSIEEQDKTTRI